MKISVIIVTYNAAKHIKECVKSLIDNASRDIPFEIVVVENASSDETVAILDKMITAYPQTIKMLLQNTNYGFSKGCNIGARDASGEILVFINPDTVCLTKNWNSIILDRHDSHSITGFQFRFPDGFQQYSIGQFPTSIWRIVFDRLPLTRIWLGVLVRHRSYYESSKKVDWVCGCGFAIDKEVFESLGGFDDNIFMYWDETDLCYRAQQQGISTFYIPYVQFIHIEEGDSFHRKPQKMYQIRKNLIYLFQKYDLPITLFLFKIILFLETGLRLIVAYAANISKDRKIFVLKTFSLVFT